MDLAQRVQRHLEALYPDTDCSALAARVISASGISGDRSVPAVEPARFSESEVVLITYGDTLSDGDRAPLQVLDEFLVDAVGGAIETVHVLPFSPASSDGGFSVIDFRSVAPNLGSWPDVERLASRGQLMADLVLNHGSSESVWFRQFVAGEAPGSAYYLTAAADEDVSAVVRPRTQELLQHVETALGPRWVWCTFSRDQVDFDFANPDVLVEFCAITDDLIGHGVSRLRLDAIAYLWKQRGTTCIHLPQTHQIVALIRTLLEVRAPHVLIITETNVPHDQNVSYFGTGDEAHAVYNFSLVPLLLHAVLSSDASAFVSWLNSTPAPVPGTTFLNFLASHDGIGLRPAEGLLFAEDIDGLVSAALMAGGRCSFYGSSDGPKPYELNVALADLLAGVDRSHIDRLVVAHAVMLALRGIPAVYIHSLLGTPSDVETMERTGHNRDINRATLRWRDVEADLADPASPRAQIFQALLWLINVRRVQPAFSPTASQATIATSAVDSGGAPASASIIAIRRESADASQVIFAVHNVGPVALTLDLSELGVGRESPMMTELIGARSVDTAGPVTIAPYGAMWLTPVG